MSTREKNDELGALWEKEGSGGTWMSGTINGEAVVCFRNDRKVAGSNQPDWRILKARPKRDLAPKQEARRAAGRPVFDDPEAS